MEDLGGDLATRVGEVLRPFMAVEQCSVGIGQGLGPRFPFQPERAAANGRELRSHHVRELDNTIDVAGAGRPARFHLR